MLSLLSLVLLLPAALALPSFVKIRDSPITLPIAARINTTGSVKLADVSVYAFPAINKSQKLTSN
jgi:hypothetical protein